LNNFANYLSSDNNVPKDKYLKICKSIFNKIKSILLKLKRIQPINPPASKLNIRNLDTTNQSPIALRNDIVFKLSNILNVITRNDYDVEILDSFKKIIDIIYETALLSDKLSIFSSESVYDLIRSYDNIINVTSYENLNIEKMDFYETFQKIHSLLGLTTDRGQQKTYLMRSFELANTKIDTTAMKKDNFTFVLTYNADQQIITNIDNTILYSTQNKEYDEFELGNQITIPKYVLKTISDPFVTVQYYGKNVLGGNDTTYPLLRVSYKVEVKRVINSTSIETISYYNQSNAVKANFTYWDVDPPQEYIDNSTCAIYQNNDFNLSACNTWLDYENDHFACECDTIGHIVVVYNRTFYNPRFEIQYPNTDLLLKSSLGYATIIVLFIIFLLSTLLAYITDKIKLLQYHINLSDKKEYFDYRKKMKKGLFQIKEIQVSHLFWDILKFTHEILSIYCFSDLYFLRIHRIMVLFLKLYIIILLNIADNLIAYNVEKTNEKPRDINIKDPSTEKKLKSMLQNVINY
jgi:hypothetical protein